MRIPAVFDAWVSKSAVHVCVCCVTSISHGSWKVPSICRKLIEFPLTAWPCFSSLRCSSPDFPLIDSSIIEFLHFSWFGTISSKFFFLAARHLISNYLRVYLCISKGVFRPRRWLYVRIFLLDNMSIYYIYVCACMCVCDFHMKRSHPFWKSREVVVWPWIWM